MLSKDKNFLVVILCDLSKTWLGGIIVPVYGAFGLHPCFDKPVLRSCSRSMIKDARRVQQREGGSQLANSRIEYVPNDEFVSVTEHDFAEIDFQLYRDEDQPGPLQGRQLAESFLTAVEQSRLLTFEGEQFLFKRLNFLRFRACALQSALKNKRRPGKTLREIDRLLSEAKETREQIACANLRLVTSISRRLANSADDFDEFLAEANTILLNAIDKFDYSRGYRFCTYVTHAVQRHIYRLISRRAKQKKHESSEELIAYEPSE
ncbi:MAG: sigma factor, partial [Aeoliella sp.]